MFNTIISKLNEADCLYTVHEHEPIRTVQDARERWPYGIDHLVKTVAFKLKDGRVILTAVRARDRIDYKRLADHLQMSRRALKTLSPVEVHDRLGVEPGAVSPIPTKTEITLFIDEQVTHLPKIYCGIGRVDRTLEIATADLQQVTQAEVTNIVKQV